MTAKATFRFKVRVAAKDPEGYYITKWGEATPVTVFAHDADEAMRKARSSMGEPPWNKRWAVMIDGADEERVDIKHADLANRLRAASADKALSIGEAWGLLDEAADALEGVARGGSMSATGYLRGHPIYFDGTRWRFSDTGDPTWASARRGRDHRPAVTGVCPGHRPAAGHSD